MSRVFVGNVDSRVNERDLEDEFSVYGVLRSVWVARRPPGYAFVEFDDPRDAQDAIRALDGKNGWRVELSHGLKSDRVGRPRGEDPNCYQCGEPGHFARECRTRNGSRGLGYGRRRSPSPMYRRSPSRWYRRSPNPRYRRSPSPWYRRSPSPACRRSPSPWYRRSPSPRFRRSSSYDRRYRRRSRS